MAVGVLWMNSAGALSEQSAAVVEVDAASVTYSLACVCDVHCCVPYTLCRWYCNGCWLLLCALTALLPGVFTATGMTVLAGLL